MKAGDFVNKANGLIALLQEDVDRVRKLPADTDVPVANGCYVGYMMRLSDLMHDIAVSHPSVLPGFAGRPQAEDGV